MPAGGAATAPAARAIALRRTSVLLAAAIGCGDHGAVAAAGLGLVERLIGAGDQCLGGLGAVEGGESG